MLLCEQKAIYFYLCLRTVMQFKCCFSYRFFQFGDILMKLLENKGDSSEFFYANSKLFTCLPAHYITIQICRTPEYLNAQKTLSGTSKSPSPTTKSTLRL